MFTTKIINYIHTNAGRMFKILGQDALYIDIPHTFKTRIMELAGDDEKEAYFKEVTERSEVEFLLNGSTEECSFFIRVPEDIDPEHIQIMADAAIAIIGRFTENQTPMVEVDGVRQNYTVLITNWEEPEIIGLNKTPGMSSGEVFKPIIQSLDRPGRANSTQQNQFFM